MAGVVLALMIAGALLLIVIGIGIGVPATIFGASASAVGIIALWWLPRLTAVAPALAIAGKALTRRTGLVIVGLYAGFVRVRVLLK